MCVVKSKSPSKSWYPSLSASIRTRYVMMFYLYMLTIWYLGNLGSSIGMYNITATPIIIHYERMIWIMFLHLYHQKKHMKIKLKLRNPLMNFLKKWPKRKVMVQWEKKRLKKDIKNSILREEAKKNKSDPLSVKEAQKKIKNGTLREGKREKKSALIWGRESWGLIFMKRKV